MLPGSYPREESIRSSDGLPAQWLLKVKSNGILRYGQTPVARALSNAAVRSSSVSEKGPDLGLPAGSD